jgi:hypothetical protein
MIPDPTNQEWKDLDLVRRYLESECPGLSRNCGPFKDFLKHHIVTRSIPEAKKVKTMAGNKIRWAFVGDERYIYPSGVRVLSVTEAYNGELWVVEKPLWSDIEPS